MTSQVACSAQVSISGDVRRGMEGQGAVGKKGLKNKIAAYRILTPSTGHKDFISGLKELFQVDKGLGHQNLILTAAKILHHKKNLVPCAGMSRHLFQDALLFSLCGGGQPGRPQRRARGRAKRGARPKS
jgi:hypothetical protein